MTITRTLPQAVAEQLVQELPSPATLTITTPVSVQEVGVHAGSAVTATFVGAVTADLALMLVDRSFLEEAAGAAALPQPAVVSITDVLRPAVESASSMFGAGVLSELLEGDASGLLSDPETVVFEIADGASAAGWFAVRVREHGTVQDRESPTGSSAANAAVAARLGRINNVEMSLTVEIGRTRMSVRDALALEPGKVIELDRSAGAPADVLLNGRLIAHGEVVVVDQDYAVRITRILDVADGHG